jgi:hypothetical protein
MALGKEIPARADDRDLAHGFGKAIEAVKARGKSDLGQKTMLDVLAPVHDALVAGGKDGAARNAPRSPTRRPPPPCRSRPFADAPRFSAIARSAIWTQARARRRSSVRQSDAIGAESMSAMSNVGIVIVSHSPRSQKVRPTWCARWSATMCRLHGAAEMPWRAWHQCRGDHGRDRQGLVGSRCRHPGRSRRSRDQLGDGGGNDRRAARRARSSSAMRRSSKAR